MYFPHAFRKTFLPVASNVTSGSPAVTASTITLASSGTTASLTAGQLGVFDSKTYTALTSPANSPFILAQGSYFASDKITPFLGGYQESVKSKVINPKYISRVFKVSHKQPQNMIVTVSISNVLENNTYRLRVDVKGSPALRFLDHNLYRVVDAYTGCLSDSTAAPKVVDPTIVAAKWADQLLRLPYTQNFYSVTVKDTTGATVSSSYYGDNVSTYSGLVATGTVTSSAVATLVITAAYVETKFGNCTFTPTDKYDLEPLLIYTSFYDDNGDPCYIKGISSTVTQTPVQASGVGETVLREMILSGRYQQEAYPDSSRVESLRMREIEANPGLATIDRNGFFDEVGILHNVPRFNNPTSTFDNDQYLITVYVPILSGATTTDTTALTNFVVGAAQAAGNNISLETF